MGRWPGGSRPAQDRRRSLTAVCVVHEIIPNPGRDAGRHGDRQAAPPGRLEVAGLGFVLDTQVDRRYHGGPEQALYAYADEDAAWWARELGRDVRPAVRREPADERHRGQPRGGRRALAWRGDASSTRSPAADAVYDLPEADGRTALDQAVHPGGVPAPTSASSPPVPSAPGTRARRTAPGTASRSPTCSRPVPPTWACSTPEAGVIRSAPRCSVSCGAGTVAAARRRCPDLDRAGQGRGGGDRALPHPRRARRSSTACSPTAPGRYCSSTMAARTIRWPPSSRPGRRATKGCGRCRCRAISARRRR